MTSSRYVAKRPVQLVGVPCEGKTRRGEKSCKYFAHYKWAGHYYCHKHLKIAKEENPREKLEGGEK